MEDNNTTVQPTPEASAESPAENTVSDSVVADKFKSYWKSQGLKDEDFVDRDTYEQAVINRYAKVIAKRQDTTEPQAQANEPQASSTSVQQPARPTTQGVDPMLELEATTYGMEFRTQFPNVDADYITSGKYLVDMVESGIPAFANGHLNRKAASTYLSMKNQAAAADKALNDYKAAQTDVSSKDHMTGTEPDNGLAKEMNEDTVRGIIAYNLQNPNSPHPQTAEAEQWSAKHAMRIRRR